MITSTRRQILRAALGAPLLSGLGALSLRTQTSRFKTLNVVFHGQFIAWIKQGTATTPAGLIVYAPEVPAHENQIGNWKNPVSIKGEYQLLGVSGKPVACSPEDQPAIVTDSSLSVDPSKIWYTVHLPFPKDWTLLRTSKRGIMEGGSLRVTTAALIRVARYDVTGALSLAPLGSSPKLNWAPQAANAANPDVVNLHFWADHPTCPDHDQDTKALNYLKAAFKPPRTYETYQLEPGPPPLPKNTGVTGLSSTETQTLAERNGHKCTWPAGKPEQFKALNDVFTSKGFTAQVRLDRLKALGDGIKPLNGGDCDTAVASPASISRCP